MRLLLLQCPFAMHTPQQHSTIFALSPISYELCDSLYIGSLQVSPSKLRKSSSAASYTRMSIDLPQHRSRIFLFLLKIRMEIKMWSVILLCAVAQQLVLRLLAVCKI